MRQTTHARRQRIADLALAGHWPSEIAQMVGMQRNSVRKILCEYRDAGTPIPEYPRGRRPRLNKAGKTTRLELTRFEYEQLQKEAKARKTTYTELVRDIVKTVIEENLFNAILE